MWIETCFIEHTTTRESVAQIMTSAEHAEEGGLRHLLSMQGGFY